MALLLAAAPARAQNSDIFREDAPPAPAPVPRPAPPPRAYSPPEPEVVAPAPQPQPAVAPAPRLPSATQIWARVRQVAASEGISVPLASNPPFDMAETPPQYRPLLGAWGPGIWGGTPSGDKMILVIEGVSADGNVQGIVGKSAGGNFPAEWTAISAPTDGKSFTVSITLQAVMIGPGGRGHPAAKWQFALRPDGTLAGSRDNNASTVVLPRLQ